MSSSLTLDIPEKALPVWENPKRYNVLYGGRGSTKSWTVARILSVKGFIEPRRILCAREIQKTLRDSVYQLLLDQQKALGLEDFYKATKDSIVGRNGTQFMFHGIRTEDITKIKSLEGCTDCWVEEAHVVSAKSWRTLTPTIRREGSVFYVTFNPELDTDESYVRFIESPPKNSNVIRLNYSDNPWFPPVLEDERQEDYERDKTHDKHVYKHVWEGQCLPAVEGAIFAEEVAKLFEGGRVRPLDHDSKGLVHGIMDLGWGVQTMLLAQRFASTVQIIGYYEWRNKTYAQISQDLRANHPNYRWGKIFMPHDASHKDPKTGKSHKDVMEELDWEVQDVPQIGVENYISMGREMFNNVYVSDQCTDLVNCLRRFKYRISTEGDRRTGVDKDDFSHGGETWCYTAVVADEMTNSTAIVKDPYKGFASGYAA